MLFPIPQAANWEKVVVSLSHWLLIKLEKKVRIQMGGGASIAFHPCNSFPKSLTPPPPPPPIKKLNDIFVDNVISTNRIGPFVEVL